MFKNYLLITIRSLLKDKVSSAIAIFGLTLGLSASILLFLYIDYQMNFDQFIPEDKKIVRLVSERTDIYNKEIISGNDSVNLYTAEKIKELNGVNDVVSWAGSNYLTVEIRDENYNEDINFISDNFFTVIPFDVIYGDRESMQVKPDYIILDKRLAEKHFGNENPVGKTIQLLGKLPKVLTVTGVVDIPKNSHVYRSYSVPGFISEQTLAEIMDMYHGVDIFDSSFDGRRSVYIDIDINLNNKTFLDDLNSVLADVPPDVNFISESLSFEYFEDIYMNDKVTNINNPKYQIILLSLLTLALLIISMINTISILTAKSINRTKEVGVRLVMGSSRTDLKVQFLTESTVLTFISLILSLVVVELILPAFSKMLLLDLDLSIDLNLITFLIVLTFLIGIISGLYPAFYLSSLRPVESLKGRGLLKLGISKKILVIIQFLVASLVVLFTLTANREIDYLNTLDPGFDCNQLIYAFPGVSTQFENEDPDKINSLREELLQLDGVEKVTYTSFIPYSDCITEENRYEIDGDYSILEELIYVDKNYFDLIDLKVVGDVKENQLIVMNSVKEYRDLEIGDLVEFGGNYYPVGGFVDDYFLRAAILGDSPKFHLVSDSNFFFQVIKYKGIADLKVIKKLWKKYYPNVSLDIDLHSVDLTNITPIIGIIRGVMNYIMILIITLSVLGLIGLILHRVKLKDKEIGIRKVMGCSVINILFEAVTETMRLQIVGVIIGVFLGVFAVTNVLEIMGYPFPPHNMLVLSLITSFVLLFIGGVITLLLFYKSAIAKPSKALRYE